MISALISLILSLAVLYIVYLVVQWILGYFPIVPAVFTKIVTIVFGVLAFVVVLQFLAALLGGTGFSGFNLK